MSRFSRVMVVALLLLPWSPLPAISADTPPIRHIPAQVCGACHQEIFRQWQASPHARSSPSRNPVHGAMYRLVAGDPGQEGVREKAGDGYPACLDCHAPNAARDGKTQVTALPVYEEGVSCVTCHTMTGFKGVHSPDGKLQVGIHAYTFGDEALTGGQGVWSDRDPRPAPAPANPYRHEARPALFKNSDLCLGCHEQLANPHGLAVCTIGDLLTQDRPRPTCQSCHMPVVEGRVAHSLGGGEDPGMLRRGVILEVAATTGEKGTSAHVTLENTLLHTYPTGAPFRSAVVRVSALDASGQLLWRNFRDDPVVEDPQAVMILQLTDDLGQPVLPMLARKVGGDSRLRPGETRVLEYDIPVAGVATVRAELLYNRVNRLLLEKIGDRIPREIKEPVLVLRMDAAMP